MRKIFWADRVEVNVPSCLSFPADCQLPPGGYSFRFSSVNLTVCGHEPAAQYRLLVPLVWIFGQTSLMKSTVPHPLLDPNIFWPFKQLLWAWQGMQSCRSQLHTVLYIPTTIPLVTTIVVLHYTCGKHPCMVWSAYNTSPSAHICDITSTVSRCLPTIWLPNSRLRSPYRQFYI